MDRGAERLDSYRVSAGLCAGTEPGGISVGLLEAARTTQRLCQRLLGVGRSSETDVETHPSSPAHPDGMLATILPTAWAHYIMRTSIMINRLQRPRRQSSRAAAITSIYRLC